MPVTIELQRSGDIERTLEKMSVEMRGPALRRAARAAGLVVERAAKRRVKRSRDTGTRDLWSKQTQADRSGVTELADTIKTVVRSYDASVLAITGPTAGGLGHLVEGGHDLVAWGHETNLTVAPAPFLEPAADETKPEQQQAVSDSLQRTVNRLASGGN